MNSAQYFFLVIQLLLVASISLNAGSFFSRPLTELEKIAQKAKHFPKIRRAPCFKDQTLESITEETEDEIRTENKISAEKPHQKAWDEDSELWYIKIIVLSP